MYVATKPWIVYISGPYSAPTEEGRQANVAKALEAAIEVAKRGHVPLMPHGYHWFDLAAKKCHLELTYSDYMTWDLALLEKCDAVYRFGASPGADLERGMAAMWEIPVFTNIYDLPELSQITTGPLKAP